MNDRRRTAKPHPAKKAAAKRTKRNTPRPAVPRTRKHPRTDAKR